jgi:predicted lipoprotein with Yx(FWY)xxD motif
MRAGRQPFAPFAGGLVLVVAIVVAACSAGGSTQPPASQADLGAASVPPAASQAPSVGPSGGPSVGPAASPTAEATAGATAGSGGGRYGGGATPTPKPTAKPTPRPTPKPTPRPTAAPMLTIHSGSTSLGTVLVNSDGLTLYFHAGDTSTHSTCTGACASAWPPLLVKAGTKVSGGTGVHGTFATFKRSDGTTQVTYKGHPLYGWQGDAYPGDTTGQGLDGFSVAAV